MLEPGLEPFQLKKKYSRKYQKTFIKLKAHIVGFIMFILV